MTDPTDTPTPQTGVERVLVARARDELADAEVVGAATDLDQLSAPDPEGKPLAAAVERALGQAGVAAADVGYVAAHGMGTRHGDASEAAAAKLGKVA